GGEEMTISTLPGQDMIWITRVHPRNAATLNIFVNSQQVGTRIVTAIPGQWLEIASYIPDKLITSSQTTVHHDANITDRAIGHYAPYSHWFYQGDYHPPTTNILPQYHATFAQSVDLVGRNITYDATNRSIKVQMAWQISATAPPNDVKVF